jgi:hypothetical protein
MRLVVSQSNYIPWKGFFDLIRAADLFVVLDNVQFTRSDWRNRNLIKTPAGTRWLTVPVRQRGRMSRAIDEIEVSAPWAQSHWDLVRASYEPAPAFPEMARLVRPLYESAARMERLTHINRLFLAAIAESLGIKTPMLDARTLPNHPDRTLRLLGLCRELGADTYLTGPSARDYLDEVQFAAAGIKLEYADYTSYPPYPQLYGPFDHQVSIIDLLANVGVGSALGYMRPVAPSVAPAAAQTR